MTKYLSGRLVPWPLLIVIAAVVAVLFFAPREVSSDRVPGNCFAAPGITLDLFDENSNQVDKLTDGQMIGFSTRLQVLIPVRGEVGCDFEGGEVSILFPDKDVPEGAEVGPLNVVGRIVRDSSILLEFEGTPYKVDQS